jgi:hypothetical protein
MREKSSSVLEHSHFVVMTGEYESEYQILIIRALTVNPPKIGLWVYAVGGVGWRWERRRFSPWCHSSKPDVDMADF